MTTSIDHHCAQWLYWSHMSHIHLVSTLNLTQDAVNPEVVQGLRYYMQITVQYTNLCNGSFLPHSIQISTH